MTRTLIISDLHLGRPRCAAPSARSLQPLWRDCTDVIVNGDAAELHHPKRWARAAREILHLHDLCEKDNVNLTLLAGNHDPHISETRHLLLAGDSIFITHGDVFHPAIAPWSPNAARIRELHDEYLHTIPHQLRNDLETHLNVAQSASLAHWKELRTQAIHSSLRNMLIRPWCVPLVLWYWKKFPAYAATFAKTHAPSAKFVILGHTHRASISTHDDITVINTGSFGFPGLPRGVLLDQHSLAVHPITYCKGEFRLGKTAIKTFTIAESSERMTSPTEARLIGTSS
ncbi:MAG TPA: metallophosphoesterase family protein [Phycisphaerales bacterium]|nr:metallophosphoesterase family protein [Phycisphaerales bacterium]